MTCHLKYKKQREKTLGENCHIRNETFSFPLTINPFISTKIEFAEFYIMFTCI